MKRLALVLTTILVMSVLLSSVVLAKPIDVKFAFWGSQEEIDMVEKLKVQFEEDNPDIRIQLQHIPADDYEQRLLVQIAGGDAPDVMTIREVSFSYFAGRGVYAPLDDLIAASDLDLSEFYPNVMDLYNHNGTQYGVPREFTPVVMYYNKDMFDEAGLDYPQEGWTWDDFVEIGQALTQDKNGDGQIDQWGTFMTPWDALYLPIIFSHGGNILSDDGTEGRLTQPETVEAFQFAYDLIHKYKIAPGQDEANSYGWINGFADGKFGMIMQGRWATPTYLGIDDVNWDVAPIPEGRKRATVMYSSGFGIAEQSKVKDAAFRWISYLAGEEGQIGFGGADALVVPANRRIANSDHFITPNVAPADDGLFISEAEQYGQVPPQTPSFAEMYEIVNRYVHEIFLGLKEVEPGLQEAETELNQMLTRQLRRLR